MTALLALAVGIVSPAVTPPAASAAGPSVVSLTSDDGNADQLIAAQTLNRYGLKGTFYVNSETTDTAGYLSLVDLRGLSAAGHEIGGHPVTHPDLVTLPADEATRQICNDRVNLTKWGFRVTSFAYPFASSNPTLETTAKNCGYNTARGLGDIRRDDDGPGSCPGHRPSGPAHVRGRRGKGPVQGPPT